MLMLNGTTDAEPAFEAPMRQSLLTQAIGSLVVEQGCSGQKRFAVDQLTSALFEDSPLAGVAYVDRLLDCGVSVDALHNTYVPGAAYRLGQMWLDDDIGFSDVGAAMTRLTEVYRRISPIYLKGGRRPGADRRALFALVPGETHALGVVMAADRFQRAGWAVRVELQAGVEELTRIAAAHDYRLIGLSAGSRRMIPTIRETVTGLRATIGSGTPIVIGGAVVALEPELASQVNADMAHCAASKTLLELEKAL